MRVSFDLDDTLICYGEGVECEPGLGWWWRVVVRDEPLRKGAVRLAGELARRGHEVWVYTTSGRSARWIRWWLRLHGVRVGGVVNGKRHAACFGEGSVPSKRPHVFGIALHVDNSPGVGLEGERYGFAVYVVEPGAGDWVERVLGAVRARADSLRVGEAPRIQLQVGRGE